MALQRHVNPPFVERAIPQPGVQIATTNAAGFRSSCGGLIQWSENSNTSATSSFGIP